MTVATFTPTTPASSPVSSVHWNKIEEYIVTYPTNKRTPRISLVVGSGELAGELIFMPNGTTLPADTQSQAHYHLDDFANVLDLLRNERPIYYIHNGPGHDNANGLQTGGPTGTGAARASSPTGKASGDINPRSPVGGA